MECAPQIFDFSSPAAGYRDGTEVSYRGSIGYYWSGTLDEYDSRYAYFLYFYSDGHGLNYDHGYNRKYGHTVRPVTE